MKPGAYPWRNHAYFFDKGGAHASTPAFLINTHRIESEADAVAYIRRLEGIRPLFEQQLARAAAAAKQGIAPPKFVYPYVVEDAGNVIQGRPFDDGPADSVLLADFRAKVGKLGIDAARREQLIGRAELALLESVEPAYDAVIAWAKETEKAASTDDGVWRLPDGASYYDYLLKNYTTTGLTADEIHAIGLAEVARIHDEMRAIMKQVGFEGDLAAFFDFMRTDERFYYPDTPEGREAWLADANRHIVAMRAKLPELFVTLPKAEVVVKAVEPFREKSAGKAFYQRPTADGSRPGVFYGNLYRMKEMPKYELEALTYHEAIPGHHMQNAIALEEAAIPRFRRSGYFTAYGEGWGLYSERLGKELGFYADPWSEFGRLALELHRARHGRYPELLQALVPGELAELLPDPFSGEPLVYRLEPDGTYVLYSVGSDLFDDGGSFVSMKTGEPFPFGPDGVRVARPQCVDIPFHLAAEGPLRVFDEYGNEVEWSPPASGETGR